MILHIDNTQEGVLKLALGQSHSLYTEIPYASPREQDILTHIEKFLIEHNIKLSSLMGIKVATGPGRFTALRTSIAVAQGLAFALHIPINGKPPGTTIEALYGKEPNISTPRV